MPKTIHDIEIPDFIAEAIDTPHAHESDGQRPIWMTWQEIEPGDGWWPVMLADNPEDARLNYRMVQARYPRSRVNVERVPLNHFFGSEMYEIAWHEKLTREQAGDRRRRPRRS